MRSRGVVRIVYISTLTDFEESTQYERFALDHSLPHLLGPVGRKLARDLQTLVTEVSGRSDAVADAVERTVHTFRPLLFGAAWKVIDLIVEYSLAEARVSLPKGRKSWPIADKRQRAFEGKPLLLPQQWKTFTALYDATAEARHCLVHRKFSVGTSGELQGMVGAHSQPLADISTRHMLAICVIAQLAAKQVLCPGSLTPSEIEELSWRLDQLAPLHGGTRIGGASWRKLPYYVIDYAQLTPDGTWVLDVPATMRRARASDSLADEFDIEVRYGASTIAPRRGRLDCAPMTPVSVGPGEPLEWLG